MNDLLISIIKIGPHFTMGYEDEKGLYSSWEDAEKGANKLLAADPKLTACVLRDLDGQLKTIERHE